MDGQTDRLGNIMKTGVCQLYPPLYQLGLSMCSLSHVYLLLSLSLSHSGIDEAHSIRPSRSLLHRGGHEQTAERTDETQPLHCVLPDGLPRHHEEPEGRECEPEEWQETKQDNVHAEKVSQRALQ